MGRRLEEVIAPMSHLEAPPGLGRYNERNAIAAVAARVSLSCCMACSLK